MHNIDNFFPIYCFLENPTTLLIILSIFHILICSIISIYSIVKINEYKDKYPIKERSPLIT